MDKLTVSTLMRSSEVFEHDCPDHPGQRERYTWVWPVCEDGDELAGEAEAEVEVVKACPLCVNEFEKDQQALALLAYMESKP